jgi:uncharacterized protein YjbJ (UPF0337 family)
MAEEPDVIRQRIDETRESLTDKLETLEGHVKEAVGAVTDTIETVKSTVENTVESVKSGVEGTVESVKTSLSDTVETVKETFDLGRQVDRHPWAAVGCSLLAGAAAGYYLAGPRHRYRYYPEGIPGMDHLIPGYRPDRPTEASAPREFAGQPARPGFVESLLQSFEGELGKVRQTAIGALIGIARDAIKEALPRSLSENVNEIMDGVARHAGGEPVRGPVLEPENANT